MVQDVVNLADKADTVLTTKGDLATYSTARTRLAVGSNDQVLTADSTEATGVKWGAVSGGNVDILGKTDLSSQATEIEVLVTQSNIPDDYAFFRVI